MHLPPLVVVSIVGTVALLGVTVFHYRRLGALQEREDARLMRGEARLRPPMRRRRRVLDFPPFVLRPAYPTAIEAAHPSEPLLRRLQAALEEDGQLICRRDEDRIVVRFGAGWQPSVARFGQGLVRGAFDEGEIALEPRNSLHVVACRLDFGTTWLASPLLCFALSTEIGPVAGVVGFLAPLVPGLLAQHEVLRRMARAAQELEESLASGNGEPEHTAGPGV